jgi:hypothetical protein
MKLAMSVPARGWSVVSLRRAVPAVRTEQWSFFLTDCAAAFTLGQSGGIITCYMRRADLTNAQIYSQVAICKRRRGSLLLSQRLLM